MTKETITPDEHQEFLSKVSFVGPFLLSRVVEDPPSFGHFAVRDFNPMSGVYKERDVYPPNDTMRAIHKGLVRALSSLFIPMPYATGGLRRCSPAKNADRHRNSQHYLTMDLKGAYEQVDLFSLAHTLVGYGLPMDVEIAEEFLNRYSRTPDGQGLVTGAPSCPLLFNIACINLDTALASVAGRYGMTYSRYLDDLTFSSPEQDTYDMGRIGKVKKRIIRETIEDCGFKINPKKTAILDKSNGPVTINGVQINSSGFFQAPTDFLNNLKEQLDSVNIREISEEEWSKLAGLYGAFVATIDTKRQAKTKIEHEIIITFRRLREYHRYSRYAEAGRVAIRW